MAAVVSDLVYDHRGLPGSVVGGIADGRPLYSGAGGAGIGLDQAEEELAVAHARTMPLDVRGELAADSSGLDPHLPARIADPTDHNRRANLRARGG